MLGWTSWATARTSRRNSSRARSVSQQVGGQHLEGDDALHGAVLGLEDAAHAAAAQLIEDAILAQDEAGWCADQQALGLEARQHTLFDKDAGDDAAPIGGGQHRQQGLELGRADQPACPQVGQEGVPINRGGCWHAYRPRGPIERRHMQDARAGVPCARLHNIRRMKNDFVCDGSEFFQAFAKGARTASQLYPGRLL